MSFDRGDRIAGYRVEREIGRGGMGVVYLAEQTALHRRVALKVIAPQLARDDAFRARFEREARLAASIDHPNVVAVYDAGQVDGALYLAMRFVEGRDLGAEIATRGRLSPDLAAHVVAAVADALDAAHARGLIHRDVKPGNVLLEGAGATPRVFLGDFGLTKDASSESGGLTRTGHWVGTVDYVAPEQLDGAAVDARTDVYALGCVLFQELSGRLPYEGTEAQKMWGHAAGPIPSLGDVSVGVADRFDGVIRRALAKDPAERYPSAGDLGRAARMAGLGEALTVAERSVATGAAATGLAGRRPAPAATGEDATLEPTRVVNRQRRRPARPLVAMVAVTVALAAVGLAGVLVSARDTGSSGVAQGGGSRQAERVRTVTVEKRGVEAPETGDEGVWPAGVSAYTTVIGSFREHAGALRRAAEAGPVAGLLWSDDYVGLTPGYWVVFVGRHDSNEEATRATEAWRRRGFTDAYNRYVQQP
jgi:tRNA A-37 threonylcarbamoyl transferase component Bud32